MRCRHIAGALGLVQHLAHLLGGHARTFGQHVRKLVDAALPAARDAVAQPFDRPIRVAAERVITGACPRILQAERLDVLRKGAPLVLNRIPQRAKRAPFPEHEQREQQQQLQQSQQ